MKTGFKALWNYKGLIVDMGVKPDKEMKPTFFIMTDDMEQIQVTITDSINLAMVRDWLDHLETGVDCHNFNGYADFVNVNIKMLKKWKIKMYIFQLFFLGLCFQKGSLFPKTI